MSDVIDVVLFKELWRNNPRRIFDNLDSQNGGKFAIEPHQPIYNGERHHISLDLS